MNVFEHDSIVVYLKDVHPKGDEDADFPTFNITVQVAKTDAGESWEAVLHSLMAAPGSNEDSDFTELLNSMGSFFDTPLKFHRTFDGHVCNFHQSTVKLATLNPAKIHKAKIEWANDHHDTRLVFQIQAQAGGDVCGVLSDYLGHKLRLETVCPQDDLDLN